jgi:hypothetical protein
VRCRRLAAGGQSANAAFSAEKAALAEPADSSTRRLPVP